MSNKQKQSPVVDLTGEDEDDEVEVVAVKTSSGENVAVTATAKRPFRNFFSCHICLEDDVESRFGYTLPSCNHRYCLSCLGDLIQSKASEKLILQGTIVCPDPTCKVALSSSDIQYIFRDEPFKWRQFSAQQSEAWIEQQLETGNDNSDMRRCPAERCNYVFVFEGRNRPVGTHFDCPLCNSCFCLQCLANNGNVGPPHEEMSCHDRLEELKKKEKERQLLEQWKIENAQADARFKELLEKEKKNGKTRECPKCNAFVTKNGGCDHMACRCGHHFNWRTGSSM